MANGFGEINRFYNVIAGGITNINGNWTTFPIIQCFPRNGQIVEYSGRRGI